jgi:hypothetical protein
MASTQKTQAFLVQIRLSHLYQKKNDPQGVIFSFALNE